MVLFLFVLILVAAATGAPDDTVAFDALCTSTNLGAITSAPVCNGGSPCATGSEWTPYVECTPHETVEALVLSGLPTLSGVLPTELCLSTDLARITIINTDLTTFPSADLFVKQRDVLTDIVVEQNTLMTGVIPTEIGALRELKTLKLDMMSLITGVLPDPLGARHTLETYDIQSIPLTGPLPPSLGLLEELTFFRVSMTSLAGTLPTVLQALAKLETLDISLHPGLTGTIPPLLFQTPSLRSVTLRANALSGRIGGRGIDTGLEVVLPPLHTLRLEDNELVGPIPTWMYDAYWPVANITDCSLAGNAFCTKPPDAFAVNRDACSFGVGMGVLDACDVCDGDGTSCHDCSGVPNGPDAYDVCGVCAGDGTGCDDCHGVAGGTSVNDVCGVCDGDGTSCFDCEGVKFGTSAADMCGVCDGDNACVDCTGEVHGSVVYDQCGVCGGTDACVGCDGVVGSGRAYDLCGVCGGKNQDCLDCAGQPHGGARRDACGVCGGDGSTCSERLVALAHESFSLLWYVLGGGLLGMCAILCLVVTLRRRGMRQGRQPPAAAVLRLHAQSVAVIDANSQVRLEPLAGAGKNA